MKKSIFSIAIAAALFTASFANAQTAPNAQAAKKSGTTAPVKAKTAPRAAVSKNAAAAKAPVKQSAAAKTTK